MGSRPSMMLTFNSTFSSFNNSLNSPCIIHGPINTLLCSIKNPLSLRNLRNYLRRFLKDNGFYMLQRSVFIGPWIIHGEFKELLKELKVELNVSIIEGRVLYI